MQKNVQLKVRVGGAQNDKIWVQKKKTTKYSFNQYIGVKFREKYLCNVMKRRNTIESLRKDML